MKRRKSGIEHERHRLLQRVPAPLPDLAMRTMPQASSTLSVIEFVEVVPQHKGIRNLVSLSQNAGRIMLNEKRLKRPQVFFRSAQLSTPRRTDRRQLPRCNVVCKLKIKPCMPAPVGNESGFPEHGFGEILPQARGAHRTRFRNAALHANGQITFFCLNFSRNWKFESRVATGVGDPCCDYLFIFVAAFVFVPDQIPVYLNTR